MVEETYKKTNDVQTRHIVARDVEKMSDASKRKEKQKWVIEKLKHDNVKKLGGIYFFDADDEEFKNIMKNARKKLKSSDASCNALQNSAQGNLSRRKEMQDKIRMHR